MLNEVAGRIKAIAGELLEGQQVEVTPNGEDYYTVACILEDGRKSNFPPVWISPSSSDQQIHEKLQREFTQSLSPETAPDDLSVPNLQNEGKQTK